MTDHRALHERLAAILRDGLHVEVPSPEADLLASGVVDSLGFAELLAGIEQEFGVEIPLEELDLDDFRSIERIARVIAGLSVGSGTRAERAG